MGSRHSVPQMGCREVGGVVAGYQSSLPSPLDQSQWVYHIKSDRKVRWYHPSSQTLGTVLYTAWEHTCFTHHTHTHPVIYYSNKSLAPPNFLWISISPWTYRHWSTSGIRMCQASLTVTLKNDSQESQPMCASVFAFVLRQWDLRIGSNSFQQGFGIQILEPD